MIESGMIDIITSCIEAIGSRWTDSDRHTILYAYVGMNDHEQQHATNMGGNFLDAYTFFCGLKRAHIVYNVPTKNRCTCTYMALYCNSFLTTTYCRSTCQHSPAQPCSVSPSPPIYHRPPLCHWWNQLYPLLPYLLLLLMRVVWVFLWIGKLLMIKPVC